MPAIIIRYFALFIMLLLLITGVFSYSYINSWMTEKKYDLTDIAEDMQKRIDAYRFYTDQIYKNLINDPVTATDNSNINLITLVPNVFYAEKSGQKTDALIFGQHDQATLNSMRKMSQYLDILWGATTDVYSLYYLNGADNSLTMISTQPLKDISSQFRGNYISSMVEARKAEMLQQANALDERESFSPLRKLRFYNDYYFTLRTTFNQPGHLATVIAFDLSINDLIPRDMSSEGFILRQQTPPTNIEPTTENEIPTDVTLDGRTLEVSAQLMNAPIKIIYMIPLGRLITNMLSANIWLILLNLALLVIALMGFYAFRRHYTRPQEDLSYRLKKQQRMYTEIISQVPIGVLVYDFGSNKVVVSNSLAERLSPHLSLKKIATLAEEHQGVIQVTVNNEMYEVRLFHSQEAPDYYLFLLREQDQEILVNKKLQLAQRELDKNIEVRSSLFRNLGQEFNQPLSSVYDLALSLQKTDYQPEQQQVIRQLIAEAARAARLMENISLQAHLETEEWTAAHDTFSLLTLMDNLLLESLPHIRQKGLMLFNHYNLDMRQTYCGDSELLKKMLSLLLDYSITNTDYGKITVSLTQADDAPEQLIIQISDTGTEISDVIQDNLRHPFSTLPLADRFNQNSGLTLFLCNQLCNKLGGQLQINSKSGLGTHYILTLILKPEALPVDDDDEKLLDGITVLLDITAIEVQHIVNRMVSSWGANCVIYDERLMTQEAALTITDDMEKLTDYTILVTSDDTQLVPIGHRRLRTNYNISQLMLDAMLKLIEQQLETSSEDTVSENADGISFYVRQIKNSDYYSLFVETVPEDLKRLYTETENGDFLSLAQTAHRLKGVFAMLNLHPGKQLCEELEKLITSQDSVQIENNLQRIERFVSALLQQG
ncbi:phosphotransferase RcsD [Prodigiosinella confusarubida]|uniref:Phosphotransferase RcsD n=1 Tax=Serratia sp. (strain ATCC 39006) TaxID=104623 RepID=A0A2I5TN31_SERS3|nr:phosphotransferase RcsD [Serratia sp. ATCC 39006]AUH01651.1 phosphotransferase RcsD [Serratia sp. ATCC 39006]AUH05974.1 phosphotransferase RcsD [Serratia sp. ATCC 39006]